MTSVLSDKTQEFPKNLIRDDCPLSPAAQIALLPLNVTTELRLVNLIEDDGSQNKAPPFQIMTLLLLNNALDLALNVIRDDVCPYREFLLDVWLNYY